MVRTYVLHFRNRTDVNVLKVLESASIFKTGTVQVVASVYGYGKVPHFFQFHNCTVAKKA
jgi:ribosomal protein L18E